MKSRFARRVSRPVVLFVPDNHLPDLVIIPLHTITTISLYQSKPSQTHRCQPFHSGLSAQITKYTVHIHKVYPRLIAAMAARADRLAELRAARKAGRTNFSSYQVEEEAQLYETVDEDSYKKIVRSRLDEDDFVVDDNGEGYADDGREDWQDEKRNDYDSESESELPARGKAGTWHRSRDSPEIVTTVANVLTRSTRSKTKTRRDRRQEGQDQQWYIQVLQQQPIDRHSCQT